ncbi:keratin-associated protein 11-1 [Sarcophilus harrisii]|uniref:Keratin-associated protein n=1 Tax=Sarcophilus harrisii TaxID=9305 RepID=A0A7N4P369_SARHA|nr:keratin-associated protein 11-1 [Sarcophilus harrisii]
MQYNCSSRSYLPRFRGEPCNIPAVSAGLREAECQNGIYLPSSFQGSSWLLDHCRETCSESTSCQPSCYPTISCTSGSSQVTSFQPGTCHTSRPLQVSFSRPCTFVSSSCRPCGGVSSVCQPTCNITRPYERPCTSNCRPTC